MKKAAPSLSPRPPGPAPVEEEAMSFRTDELELVDPAEVAPAAPHVDDAATEQVPRVEAADLAAPEAHAAARAEVHEPEPTPAPLPDAPAPQVVAEPPPALVAAPQPITAPSRKAPATPEPAESGHTERVPRGARFGITEVAALMAASFVLGGALVTAILYGAGYVHSAVPPAPPAAVAAPAPPPPAVEPTPPPPPIAAPPTVNEIADEAAHPAPSRKHATHHKAASTPPAFGNTPSKPAKTAKPAPPPPFGSETKGAKSSTKRKKDKNGNWVDPF